MNKGSVWPVVFISVLTFSKTQENNLNITLATLKVRHKEASQSASPLSTTKLTELHLHTYISENLKIWRIIEIFTDQAASKAAGEGSCLQGLDPYWYLARRVPALVSLFTVIKMLSTSSKSRKLELKALNFSPWKSISKAHPKAVLQENLKSQLPA